jgi:hypothetical protein
MARKLKQNRGEKQQGKPMKEIFHGMRVHKGIRTRRRNPSRNRLISGLDELHDAHFMHRMIGPAADPPTAVEVKSDGVPLLVLLSVAPPTVG